MKIATINFDYESTETIAENTSMVIYQTDKRPRPRSRVRYANEPRYQKNLDAGFSASLSTYNKSYFDAFSALEQMLIQNNEDGFWNEYIIGS